MVATVPAASEQDIASAVAAAARAQPAWAALAAGKRAAVLRRFSDLMAQNASKLAEVGRILLILKAETHPNFSSTQYAWASRPLYMAERLRQPATSPISSQARLNRRTDNHL